MPEHLPTQSESTQPDYAHEPESVLQNEVWKIGLINFNIID
jgi:hypothetical protein